MLKLLNEKLIIFYINIRVCKAPRLCQIKPDFFLVVRLVLKSMCMKFGVNRSMFTGSRFDFTVSASRAGSNTSQTVISQARKVIERSVTTQNVQNNSLVNNKKQSELIHPYFLFYWPKTHFFGFFRAIKYLFINKNSANFKTFTITMYPLCKQLFTNQIPALRCLLPLPLVRDPVSVVFNNLQDVL